MPDLFSDIPNDKRTSLGGTEIAYKNVTSILTEAKGFMGGYDYTLNPYSGCSFGCTYCYAAFFARTDDQRVNWGNWVSVKENALQLLIKFRKKGLRGKTIYMSSVTDPYQPIERDLQLTRSLLKELIDFHQPRLVIQTRSPIIVRDIDLLKQFSFVQINMTITTDSERVRKVFEPYCPSNVSRLDAIKAISLSGLNSCITMTPLLPIENPEEFAKKLIDTGVKKFIIQPFHPDKGKFVASTGEKAKRLLSEMGWTKDKYQHVLDIMRKYIPDIGIGKEGFKPL